MAEDEGANPNQQLLFAARTDNLELLQEVLSGGAVDVNFADGLGNTALHYAAASASTSVLPALLEEEVDVDLTNKLEGNTPLHEAVLRIEDEDERAWVVEQLLEAGADPRIVNKDGDKPSDAVRSSGEGSGSKLKEMLRRAEALAGIDMGDVANDDDDEDDGPPSDED
ncbi:hypothetical protein OC846_001709 [Tilletia horrida]|uniref:Ankyrin n=1 Tax=Tilletia horrida TaxID=155126 RepID=A0AAN6GSR3_9BASI|nr:hypothetical protein OC845_003233 [Tilletia horrida]KAK0555449.1 hypothetical protein OC846_001709 [Tilletia horrida]KAK0567402.1 hypothetical protein OC861_002724 [Tilletia horrida]